jgi:putative transposase
VARIPRIVVPGLTHHVTQRGVRRQRVFFENADFELYLSLLGQWVRAAGVAIHAYCLMPNHVHLVVVPQSTTSLATLFRGLHAQYAELLNARNDWKGHLWQQRFNSCPMDESHLVAALRYVLLNPVRAGLAHRATDWPWSSVRSHLGATEDPVLARPVLRIDARALDLDRDDDSVLVEQLRAASRTGRPLGPDSFVRSLEERTGRRLLPRPPGPQPARMDAASDLSASVSSDRSTRHPA